MRCFSLFEFIDPDVVRYCIIAISTIYYLLYITWLSHPSKYTVQCGYAQLVRCVCFFNIVVENIFYICLFPLKYTVILLVIILSVDLEFIFCIYIGFLLLQHAWSNTSRVSLGIWLTRRTQKL